MNGAPGWFWVCMPIIEWALLPNRGPYGEFDGFGNTSAFMRSNLERRTT
jgi:hypothetical protein